MLTPRHPHPPRCPAKPSSWCASKSSSRSASRVSTWWTPEQSSGDTAALCTDWGRTCQSTASNRGMLQNSPPEIAALGYLILRVFERSQS